MTDNGLDNSFHVRNDGIPGTESIVERLEGISGKVDDMRASREKDPDSFGDKILTMLVPTASALIAGKAFSAWWKRRGLSTGTSALHDSGHESDNLLVGVAFAALSAAFVAVVSQLSERGSRAYVDRRHRRNRGSRS